MEWFTVDHLINGIIALLVYALNVNLASIKNEIKNVGKEVTEAKDSAKAAHQRIDNIILNK